MNVSPWPAGHLYFDRLEKFVFKKKLVRKKLIFSSKFSDFRFQNFRFQISKFADFSFQNFSYFRFQISKNFRFRKISKFSDFAKSIFQILKMFRFSKKSPRHRDPRPRVRPRANDQAWAREHRKGNFNTANHGFRHTTV